MRPRTIFLAGSLANHAALRVVRSALIEDGHTVKARWLDRTLPDICGPNAKEEIRAADEDMQDLLESDTVILDTHMKTTSGGRDSEAGMAVVAGKCFWLVGRPYNIYHYLAQVMVSNWATALNLLKPR